jgi:hypothetical protein
VRVLSRYHFSIDDVSKTLIEASDSGAGLFAHPFYALLESIHDAYGIEMDLYLFERTEVAGRTRALSEVSDRLRADFDRTRWIRLGPHARDYATAPYAQTPENQIAAFSDIYREIDRFAGRERRAKWVRLHYFSEAYEAAPFLKSAGVEALLLTDKDAAAYRLGEAKRVELREKGRVAHAGIELVRSHLRVENLVGPEWPWPKVEAALEAPLRAYAYLSLFTHEYELDRKEVRERMRECSAWLAARSLLPI